MQEGVGGGVQCMTAEASRRRLLLLFDGFFRGQGVLLLGLRLLQLGLVEAGHLGQVWFVAHCCRVKVRTGGWKVS